MEPRAAAFARLFEAVREGVFIGTLPIDSSVDGTTLAANPYLKSMFGFPVETPEADVAPFDPDRFGDPTSRTAFLDRITRDGVVTDYLLRMRRLDGSPVWVEVTARLESAPAGAVTVEALVRDVSERKKVDDQSRDL